MAKKRANGEGTIRKRADGSWEARLVVSTDPLTGKTKRKSIYGKTQAEVRKKMTTVKREIDLKIFVDASNLTISQWAEQWLSIVAGKVKPTTLRIYKNRVKNAVNPYLGDMKVQDITPIHLASWYAKLSEEMGYAPGSVANAHAILYGAFEALIDANIIAMNPCVRSSKYLPQKKDVAPAPLKDDTLQKFLKVIKGTKDEKLYLFLLMTGMRKAEMFGLQWSCVDFEKKSILIDKQLCAPIRGYSYRLTSTKNGKSRVIHPPEQAFEILLEMKQRRDVNYRKNKHKWNDKGIPDLVFVNDIGWHVSNAAFSKRFHDLMVASGLSGVRLHDLRHAYTTLAIEAGVNVKTLQESLGHATASFTLERYADSTKNAANSGAKKMQMLIANIIQ